LKLNRDENDNIDNKITEKSLTVNPYYENSYTDEYNSIEKVIYNSDGSYEVTPYIIGHF